MSKKSQYEKDMEVINCFNGCIAELETWFALAHQGQRLTLIQAIREMSDLIEKGMPAIDEHDYLVNQFSDHDLSENARTQRYQEFLGLKKLPFLNTEQNSRLTILKKLRTRDNRYAFA